MSKQASIDLALSKVVGHRGACGHAPENTLASFIKAKELGVDWVEFDVQLTADNKLVVFHDLDFSRLANDYAILSEVDYAQCSQYDVGSHFAPEYRGQTVPLLEDVLRYLIEVNITPNIEVKPNGQNALAIAEALIHLLEHTWPHDRMPPLVSSFDHDILASLRGMDSVVALGYLCENLPSNWADTAQALRCFSIHIDHHFIDSATVEAIHNKGYQLATYTCNDPDRAKKLFSWGVDAVISDYPERILSLI